MNRPKVFLAEDNQNDGLLLDLAFADAGWSVKIDQVHDGVRAFELLRSAARLVPFPFQLIVLDLQLPRMDGLELLLAIRNWPELTNVPIVILTTSTTVHERDRIQDLHCNLMMKPNDYRGLSVVVAKLASYLPCSIDGVPDSR